MQKTFLVLVVLFAFAACSSDKKEKEEAKEATKPESMSIEKYMEAMNRQLKTSPNNYALYNERSQIYLKMDSLDKAIQDVEKALSINDSIADSHYLRGFYACLAQDTIRAIAELQKALTLGTPNPEASYQLGQIFLYKENYPEAARLFEVAARLDTSAAMYVFAKGILAEKQKKISEAVNLYQKAIAKDSLFAKAYIQLHDLYLRHFDNPEEAFKYNDMLLRKMPAHPLAHYNKANRAFNQAVKRKIVVKADAFAKEMEKAIVEYNAVIRADSNFLPAYYERGYTYFIMDKYDEAIKDFEKCLQKKENHFQAAFMLGSIHEYYKDKATALRYYKKAVEAKPDFKEALDAVDELSK